MNELAPIKQNGIYVVPPGSGSDDVRAMFPPASASEISKMIALLFSAMKAGHGSDVNAEMMHEAYSIALEGRPIFAIEAAVRAFITGQVHDASKVFVPATAELVGEIERQFWLRIRSDKPARSESVPVLPDDHFSKRWESMRDELVGKLAVSDD